MEWLKEVLGDAYSEEIDKKISTKIGNDFVSRVDFNVKNDTVKALKEEIESRDKQLEELKAVDADGLKKRVEELQEENNNQKVAFENQINGIQFNNALDNALLTAKSKNIKAVKALLDLDKLEFKDGKVIGIDEQIKELKEQNDYLFETKIKIPKFADKTPGIKPSGITQEQFGKMGYTERLKLKQTSPETYKALRDETAGQEERKDN